MALQQLEVPIRHGYDIGIGVASGSGSPMALGATGAVSATEVAPGGTGDFNFKLVSTTQELETELGIDADASGGIGLFSASAAFDFARHCKIQTSSLCILVSSAKTFAFQQMDSPVLSGPAQQVSGQAFADQFGDYFVRGINSGGRFIGVVRIDTQSDDSRTSVHGAMGGNYGGIFGGAISIDFKNALKTAGAVVSAWYHYEGGFVDVLIDADDPAKIAEGLHAATQQWMNSVRKQPAAYTVTLAPYAVALGPPPPDAVQLEHQRDVLIRCAKLRSITLDKLNLLDYILDPLHTAEFAIEPSGPNLPELQAAIASDLDVISEAASYALDNPKDACEVEDYMAKVRHVPNFTLTPLPANMPKHVGRPAPTGPNSMPNLVGQPASALLSLLSCIQMEDVDHCIKFLGSQLDPLADDVTPLANFFFYVLRSGTRFNVNGDPNPPGAIITSQSPPPGTLVRPDTRFTITI